MDDVTTARITFNTDTLPERDRFAAYCEHMMRRIARLDIMRRDASPFAAAVDIQQAGSVGICHIATSTSDYVRTPVLMRDGDDSLCIVLCRSGGAYQTQRDNDQGLAPGEAIVCDSGRLGSIHVTANSRFWCIKVPRPRIATMLPRHERFAGIKLDRDPVARRLLFAYLAGTLNLDLPADGQAVALYDHHILDLLALSIGAEGEARRMAEEGGVRAVRRAAILREIDNRLHDPALSAAGTAIRLGITPRYIHVLLEESGHSFSEHVLERRLAKIAEVLRDPRQRRRRIGDVALAHGFSDLSHFNRAFRRRYGATPSQMRRQGAAKAE
ncbi:MAG TPA: helix-turn-helix domain-containing protein [Xanthobacteraceae bacterium]|nr:helix-turn-helix domain-containing protein [Xanthobacteraceae bacterium]